MATRTAPTPRTRHECESCGQEFPRSVGERQCPTCGWVPERYPDESSDEIADIIKQFR